MSHRKIYLLKSRASPTQRFHFSLFIPNPSSSRPSLPSDFRTSTLPCIGTVIHVVGEPLLAGFRLEFKRNFDCVKERDVREMVELGEVEEKEVYAGGAFGGMGLVLEYAPCGRIEQEASFVRPPPNGQDVRRPVDGVTTRRCQEWTMEFLERLVRLELLDPEALVIAQGHRDTPTHGIFGMRGVEKQQIA